MLEREGATFTTQTVEMMPSLKLAFYHIIFATEGAFLFTQSYAHFQTAQKNWVEVLKIWKNISANQL